MNTEFYFKQLDREVKKIYSLSEEAKAKGFDPVNKVEIPLARSLAEKVVGLISTVYPQIEGSGIVNRILDLEKEHGKLDMAVAFKIAEEISKQKFCQFKTLVEAIDAGIRVGFSYITLGVVSSPIEGYTGLKIGKTRKDEEYFIANFSGPIRSAGTTASCMVLMLIDYLRELFGYAKYDPSEEEVKRYVTECYDYHERITNLQYIGTEQELTFLAKNLPIQIDGDPTEKLEVSNYKNLHRVGTNLIRGGMCLTFSEGLAQKAKKGLRLLNGLKNKGFQITSWDFLKEYVELHDKRDTGKTDDSPTYIKDLVAGRPIFGHPSRSGAFRFRYGRGRNSGFSATCLHPATMAICDGFIAIGTQLKIEKPTKGTVVGSCDIIEGPIVKLANGSVRKIKTKEEAKRIYPSVEEIIYIGDILFPFSDIANRNSMLLKPGYVEEWWGLELREKNNEIEKIIDCYNVEFEKAIELSREYKIPLHPSFIFYWTQISKENFFGLIDWMKLSRINKKIILPYAVSEREKFKQGKRALEILGIEHDVVIENVIISEKTAKALFSNLGLDFNLLDKEEYFPEKEIEEIESKIKKSMVTEQGDLMIKTVLELVNSVSAFTIKDKAGDFIGARMGRPEKAKIRKLTGSPNVLFPVGSEGGRLRSVEAALEKGRINNTFPIYYCEKCMNETIYPYCESCKEKTSRLYYCSECGKKSQIKCKEHGKSQPYFNFPLDIRKYFEEAKKKLGFSKDELPVLIKGIRGTSSKNHVMEHLAKGFLRAKNNLQVNKDGTIRFDATELPLISFKPKEVSASVEKLRSLGYDKDIYGKELIDENQILELMPHDVVLPSSIESFDEQADKVFARIGQFMDELLVRFYNLPAFYNIKKKEDLIGHIGVCMAPHNCAGVICRFIGFSNTLGILASPYLHAAVRRDCFDYDTYIPLKREDGWHIEKIGEFSDKINPREKVDNFGTLKENLSKTFTWSNKGKSAIKEITKHEPSKMLKLYLEDGRKIELTENHLVYLKGKTEKLANQLKIGDKLTISYKKDIEEKDIKEFFLPDIFQDREDIMLRNIRDYLNGFENLEKNTNFYIRNSFPIKFVKIFLEKYNKTLRDLPSEVKIAIKRDKVEIPINIKLTDKLLEVLGLYIAEGYSRSIGGKKGLNQVYIAASRQEIRDFVKETMKKTFGLEPTEKKEDRVTFSSKILYELFVNYLHLGSNAKEKRIPNLFLDLKKEKLANLLRGYFEGDGSVSLTDIRVTCDTISEGLKQDLSFVLSRFGIFVKFYEYEKEPGPKVKEFYIKKNRKIPKFKITKIIIPSDFVKNFNPIGFISERKNKIFQDISKKNPKGMRIEFDKSYVYPKIIKIEEIGKKVSYCLNVPSEHNFFANDILVHNCDGDELSIMLLGDVLINFSREFLPSHRGGTQDAPLVLNAKIDAGEVDDQILDFELTYEYPIELYRMAERKEHSSKVQVNNVKIAMKKGINPFENMGFTHNTSNFNDGVVCSSYKLLATMQEKVEHQMRLVEKIRAVDTSDTARLIIERHFMKDLKGNLRKFSTQDFRCVACNEILRRPPLSGVCSKCGGKIIFTINEGGIKKYLEAALNLAEKYNLSSYIRQNLELTKRYIDSIFGRELEKQEALKKWF